MPAAFDIARKRSPQAAPRANLKADTSRSNLTFPKSGRGTLNPARHAAPSGVACPCGGGCPRCQAEKQSSLANPRLSQPGDAAEHEADHVADHVIRTPSAGTSTHASITGQTDLRISRHPATSASGHSQNAPPSVHHVLKSRGQALGTDARSLMEPRFGRNFSDVQIHTDAKAAESADAVNARAYTVGPHVVFGRGQYDPSTLIGRHLLAHELTHVVQQSAHGAHALQRQPKQSAAPDSTAIDPKNLGTLGPAFKKSETEVRKLHLKEMRLGDSTDDPDFVLFWAQNSTVPLRKLRPGTPVFSTGTAKGKKTLVWAYPDGEADMFMGFVKTELLQDPWAADWVKRQPPWFSLKPPDLSAPDLSAPSLAPEPPFKSSWDEAMGTSDPDQPVADLPQSNDPTRIDWKIFHKIVSEALAKHNNIAWDAFGDVYAQRNAIAHIEGEPNPCLDPNLAAADHYLFARSLVMDFHFPAYFVKLMDAGYKPFKNALLSQGFDPALGKCQTSPGTVEQQLAGDMGADSGSLIDHPENWKYHPFGGKLNY
ncbi:MAG TPA: DUF4157 domain-containing protein [Opitutaceae bacterium]|jgi:hypothetical protein|nr:DUF4157 domain-containing protein [Opitutaceae bacterium]